MDESLPEESFVSVWEGPYVEAQERLRWLEEAHIPVDLGDALLPGRARVEVAAGYAEEARLIMGSGPLESSPPYPALTPSSGSNVWKVALAVILVAALVLAFVL